MRRTTELLLSFGLALLGFAHADPASAAARDVQFKSINFATGVIELHNYGSAAVSLNGWQLCSANTSVSHVYTNSSGFGSRSLNPDQSVRIHLQNDAQAGAADDVNVSQLGAMAPISVLSFGLGLYFPPVTFSNGNSMADYLQWGTPSASSSSRSTEAVSGGLWTSSSSYVTTTAATQQIVLIDSPSNILDSGTSYGEPPVDPPVGGDASVDIVNLFAVPTSGGSQYSGGSLELRVNGSLQVSGLAYGATSTRVAVPSGTAVALDATLSASSATPAHLSVTLASGEQRRLVAVGDAIRQPYVLLAPAAAATPPPAGMTQVRFINGASSSTDAESAKISVRNDDGTVYAGAAELGFGTASAFQSAPAGSTNLKFTNKSGQRNLADPAAATFAAGSSHTWVLGGNGDSHPYLVYDVDSGSVLTLLHAIDLTYDGAFFDPAQSGQGFFINVIPGQNRMIAGWFTWTNTVGQQDWFYLDSEVGGFTDLTSNMIMYRGSGGRFEDGSAPVAVTNVGTVKLVFTGCNTAQLTIHRTDQIFDKTKTLQRLTPLAICTTFAQ